MHGKLSIEASNQPKPSQPFQNVVAPGKRDEFITAKDQLVCID